MPRLFKILGVGFAPSFEFIFLLTYNRYPHGEIVDVRYRGKERVTAYFDYRRHLSLATKATFDEEMRLMHRHEDWKGYAVLGLIVVANVAGIYYFLRFEIETLWPNSK